MFKLSAFQDYYYIICYIAFRRRIFFIVLVRNEGNWNCANITRYNLMFFFTMYHSIDFLKLPT